MGERKREGTEGGRERETANDAKLLLNSFSTDCNFSRSFLVSFTQFHYCQTVLFIIETKAQNIQDCEWDYQPEHAYRMVSLPTFLSRCRLYQNVNIVQPVW